MLRTPNDCRASGPEELGVEGLRPRLRDVHPHGKAGILSDCDWILWLGPRARPYAQSAERKGARITGHSRRRLAPSTVIKLKLRAAELFRATFWPSLANCCHATMHINGMSCASSPLPPLCTTSNMSRQVDEERQQELRQRHATGDDDVDFSKVQSKSPGVRRMEAINDVWTFKNKMWFIVALVILTCESHLWWS